MEEAKTQQTAKSTDKQDLRRLENNIGLFKEEKERVFEQILMDNIKD